MGKTGKKKTHHKSLLVGSNATQIICVSFVLLIALGTLLLTLPAASRSGRLSVVDAMFTATSATCVTGLVVRDTWTQFTMFGQVVILLLIQVGGLGLVTLTSFFALAAKRRMGFRDLRLLGESVSASGYSQATEVLKIVIRLAFLFEAIGIVLLAFAFVPQFGLEGIWISIFTAISAFCNAGFDLFGRFGQYSSLVPFVHNYYVQAVVMFLIMAGGLGFMVWVELGEWRKKRRLSLHAKVVLAFSAILWVGGAVLIALMEWSNPKTMGGFSADGKIMAALFQSVTLRTAGFASFNQDALTEASKLLSNILMFVGGSSGSTAGGVKTVTMGLVVLSAVSTMRGRRQVTVFRRSISQQDISNAVSVALLVLGLSLFGAAVLTVCDRCSFLNAIYETTSALCTVGLTTGITGTLCAASKLILIVFMFFGRVGIMTIGVGFMMGDRARERVQYAETKVMIG